MGSSKDEAHSDYRLGSQNFGRRNNFDVKSHNYGLSTNGGTSAGNKTKSKPFSTGFPSLSKISATFTTNKILDRIHQI